MKESSHFFKHAVAMETLVSKLTTNVSRNLLEEQLRVVFLYFLLYLMENSLVDFLADEPWKLFNTFCIQGGT